MTGDKTGDGRWDCISSNRAEDGTRGTCDAEADSVGTVTGQIGGAIYGLDNIPHTAIEAVKQWVDPNYSFE